MVCGNREDEGDPASSFKEILWTLIAASLKGKVITFAWQVAEGIGCSDISQTHNITLELWRTVHVVAPIGFSNQSRPKLVSRYSANIHYAYLGHSSVQYKEIWRTIVMGNMKFDYWIGCPEIQFFRSNHYWLVTGIIKVSVPVMVPYYVKQWRHYILKRFKTSAPRQHLHTHRDTAIVLVAVALGALVGLISAVCRL